jgi:hypothetical protein
MASDANSGATWPCVSPVMATEECPQSSDITLRCVTFRREREWRHGSGPAPCMLATRNRIVVGKKSPPGRKAVIHSWSRWDFAQFGVGQWLGTGPLYEVRTDPETAGRIVFVFRTFRAADALGTYFLDE